MDLIKLSGVECRVKVGVPAAERARRQKILVDASLEVDARPAAARDDFRLAVDYWAVEKLLRAEAETGERALIETLAERLAAAVLRAQPLVSAVTIAVHKTPAVMPKTRAVTAQIPENSVSGGKRGSEDGFELMARAMREVEVVRPGVAASMGLLQKAMQARVTSALLRARLALQRSRGRRKAVSATARTLAAEAAAAREAARTALRELKRAETALKGQQGFDKRERVRRELFLRLSRMFARAVKENKALRAELERAPAAVRAPAPPAPAPVVHVAPAAPPPVARAAPAGPDPMTAYLESELEESRETVAVLIRRVSTERRRWKAALLAVRKRLLRASPKLAGKLAEMEKDLEESREAQANLLVELTRARREARARQAVAGKTTRAKAPAAEPAAESVEALPADASGGLAIAREAYTEALGDRLARLSAPRASAEERDKAGADAVRLARGLRLAAEAAASLPSRANPAVMLERRLESWQPVFAARGSTVECAIKPTNRQVVVAPAAFRLLLDELLSNTVERLPPGGELTISAGEMPDGSYAIAFSDDGPGYPADWMAEPFPREPRPVPQRPGLGLTVSRELARRWGGELTAVSAKGVRGARLVLRLVGARA